MMCYFSFLTAVEQFYQLAVFVGGVTMNGLASIVRKVSLLHIKQLTGTVPLRQFHSNIYHLIFYTHDDV